MEKERLWENGKNVISEIYVYPEVYQQLANLVALVHGGGME
jgi:hypothetical protein